MSEREWTDDVNPDAARIAEILDGIPGAWERTQESLEQVRQGQTVPLSELLRGGDRPVR